MVETRGEVRAMEPQHWQTVEEIFHAVMESEESQRSAVLDRACAGDEALRREVESLLRCDQRAGQILEKPAFEAVAEVLAQERLRADEAEPASDDKMIGARIAQYQIVAKLGAGGMGLVYRAVRADDQYQQQVAIKVVQGGGECSAIVRRFKNERQILAGLAHPNIARLLDGGITKEGAPYFVMELIEGESIDRYCDSRQLGIPE